ncbi:MAG TPA: hypothetical protein VMZ74_12870 [Ramlibacter sp.]|nr:hypothetical protein [Ramlibacter sp.]
MSKTHQFFAAAFSLAFVAGAARAQSEASVLGDVSALPLASVATGSLAGSDAVFVVTAVEASAYATLYTLERGSDGTRINVQVTGRGLLQTTAVAGAVVTANLTSTGTVLMTGSHALAFVPNALGRALMANERVSL